LSDSQAKCRHLTRKVAFENVDQFPQQLMVIVNTHQEFIQIDSWIRNGVVRMHHILPQQ
jgi:hypothetical protein